MMTELPQLDHPLCNALTLTGNPDLKMCLRNAPQARTTNLLRLVPHKRAIFLGRWQNQQVIIKAFFERGNHARHRQQEVEGIAQLSQMSIVTPECLYHGTLGNDERVSIVITPYVSAPKLSEVWIDATDDQRSLWFANLMDILAYCHQHNLTLVDAHFNNFLVDETQLITLDGGSVKRLSRLPGIAMVQRICHTALTLAQLRTRDDGILQKAFADQTFKHARLVRWATTFMRWKKAKKLARKACRDCTAYATFKSHGYRCFVNRDYDQDQIRMLLSDPDAAMAQMHCLKDGNTTTVAKGELGGVTVVIKRYNLKNRWTRLKRMLFRSRALRAWHNAHYLKSMGIHTPPPIAMIDSQNQWRTRPSFFIYAYTPGECLNAPIESDRFDTITALFKQLSLARISHGDLKASNFILSNDKIYLIDVDAVALHLFMHTSKRALRKSVLRFLENWEGDGELQKKFELALT